MVESPVESISHAALHGHVLISQCWLISMLIYECLSVSLQIMLLFASADLPDDFVA